MVKKIYLSMPITGYDIKERENYAFLKKRELQDKYCCDVVSPFEIAPYDPSKTWEDCMKTCIKALVDCDYIYMADKWENSRGCKVEKYIAENLDLKFLDL